MLFIGEPLLGYSGRFGFNGRCRRWWRIEPDRRPDFLGHSRNRADEESKTGAKGLRVLVVLYSFWQLDVSAALCGIASFGLSCRLAGELTVHGPRSPSSIARTHSGCQAPRFLPALSRLKVCRTPRLFLFWSACAQAAPVAVEAARWLFRRRNGESRSAGQA